MVDIITNICRLLRASIAGQYYTYAQRDREREEFRIGYEGKVTLCALLEFVI